MNFIVTLRQSYLARTHRSYSLKYAIPIQDPNSTDTPRLQYKTTADGSRRKFVIAIIVVQFICKNRIVKRKISTQPKLNRNK